jgi:hypothetical protein
VRAIFSHLHATELTLLLKLIPELPTKTHLYFGAFHST